MKPSHSSKPITINTAIMLPMRIQLTGLGGAGADAGIGVGVGAGASVTALTVNFPDWPLTSMV